MCRFDGRVHCMMPKVFFLIVVRWSQYKLLEGERGPAMNVSGLSVLGG